MPSGYICLQKQGPRSLLFYIVANVGPGGSSRPLAVAYRQGNDLSRSSLRVTNLVDDTLSVITIMSEPENHAVLETERARAVDWYIQQEHDGISSKPPALPDSSQPPFLPWNAHWEPVSRPELPNNGSSIEFPRISELLVDGLSRGTESTRKGDIQLPFTGNRLEYGMVLIDISNFESVTYGIVAFPVCYMATVFYHSEYGGWDPVEDGHPREEPDITLVDERPRQILSILDYIRKHFPFLDVDPKVLELEAHPRIRDSSSLDCRSTGCDRECYL